MFFVVRVSDSIPLNPSDFRDDFVDCTIELIKNKFVDKLLPNVGLVVALYDVVELKEAIVQRLDGKTLMKLTFRLIVFKPFIGEIITGRITSSDTFGLKVSIGFFDDIRIPCTHLHNPTSYDSEEQTWCWKFGEHTLFYDIGEHIRFRVTSVIFPEIKHDGPKDAGIFEKSSGDLSNEPFMSILGSVEEDGLGLPSWWGQ